MTKSIVGGLLVLVVLAASSGCNVCRAILYDPFGPNTLFDGRRCGRVIGEECGPVCSPLDPAAVVEGPGRWEGCNEYGTEPCVCRRGLVRGPLAFVFALFSAGTYRGCYAGCGERYWGDWYSDPPELCGPCDDQGNFLGGSTPWLGGTGPMSMNEAEATRGAAPGGCRNCGQGGQTSFSPGVSRNPAYLRSTPRHYATATPPPPQRSSAPSYYPSPRAPEWQASRASRAGAQSPYPTGPSTGPYAPRLISTTDRVVSPMPSEAGPRLAPAPRSASVQ